MHTLYAVGVKDEHAGAEVAALLTLLTTTPLILVSQK